MEIMGTLSKDPIGVLGRGRFLPIGAERVLLAIMEKCLSLGTGIRS